MLLLAVLDIGKLVELLKNEETLNADSHQLGTPSARQEVNKSFQALAASLPKGSSSMGPPLLLAWATFLCLANSMDKSGRGLDVLPQSSFVLEHRSLDGTLCSNIGAELLPTSLLSQHSRKVKAAHLFMLQTS